MALSRFQKAFTLIELLIVVAIIGILAAIAVPNFLNAQMRATVTRVISDLKAIETAVEMYGLDNNSYPNDGYRGFFIRPNGWVQLTTPIGYIATGSLHDPFKPDHVGMAGDQDPNTNKALYEMGTGNSRGDASAPFNEWMVNSLGPDAAFGADGGGGPVGDNTGSALGYPFTNSVWRYDMTNGLRSRGDIYRFRGGQPASQVMYVDGKPWGTGA